MWDLLGEFGYDMSHPSIVLMDKLSTIRGVKRPALVDDETRAPACHWIDSVLHGDVEVSHVPGNETPGGIFTKPLGRLKFANFHAILGMRV